MSCGTTDLRILRSVLITAAVCLAAAAVVCCLLPSDGSDATVEVKSDGFTAVVYAIDDVRVVAYDGDDSNPRIPDDFEDGGLVYHPTWVDLDIFSGDSMRAPAKTMTVLTIPDTVTQVAGDTGDSTIFKKLETVNLGTDYGGTLDFIYRIRTLKEVNVDSANAMYSSSEGVVYSADMEELLFYPCEKGAASYTLPKQTLVIDDRSSIHTNGHLETVDVEEGNTSFMAKHGILYDKSCTVMVLYPAANGMDTYVVPSGVQSFSHPLQSNHLTKIVFPGSFEDGLLELGMEYGRLSIPKGALASKFAETDPFTLCFDKPSSVPSEVSDASRNDFYLITVDGTDHFDSPVNVRLYQVRYLASNMHILHVDDNGNTTDIEGVERSRDGASFNMTLTGYYTYMFNDTTTIKHAPEIALAIAAAGTVAALVTVIRNRRSG